MAKNEYPKYGIVPIGRIKRDIKLHKNIVEIRVEQAYTKALLGLKHFSHGLVFYEIEGRLSYLYLEWIDIDELSGKVLGFMMNGLDYKEEVVIFDIKPYFPNEDHVKLDYKRGCHQVIGNLLESKDQIRCLSSIGQFQLIGGNQYIILDPSVNMDYLRVGYCRTVWWFNRFEKKLFRKSTTCHPPYEEAPETGIFATRSPVRPNPIASTLVEVLDVDKLKHRIRICGFDGFDNSDIVGIMPYEEMMTANKEVELPKWLKHWPKYKSFEQVDSFEGDIKLEAGPLEELANYIEDIGLDRREVVVSAKKSEFEHNIIRVVNASQNNLKSIDVKIKKNEITVITGASGSGKSSLAFDTIYTESQRQFMDIMGSDRNRTFEKPSVERVDGLQPAIAIEQKSLGQNPRSTVGTVTGIIDYLRSLYVTIGTRYCPECHKPIQKLKQDEIKHIVEELKQNHTIKITPDTFDDEVEVYDIVIDRKHKISLQTKEYCYDCNRVFFDLSTAMFSYNNPDHMCPKCKGLGEEMAIDPNKVISDREKSILDGASKIWGDLRKHAKKPNANWMRGEVLALAYDMNVDLELAYKDLPEDFKEQLLYGSNGRKVTLTYDAKGRSGVIERPAEGLMNIMKRLMDNNAGGSSAMNKAIDGYMSKSECGSCHGERLADEGRLVAIEGIRYPIAAAMKVDRLKVWLLNLYQSLPKRLLDKARLILDELIPLLTKIEDVGLSYLAMDRSIPSLSGGEGQRLRLASQFATNLTNILYVLDEPSMGLHPVDYAFLISELRELRDRDNTIIMVEHERDMIMMADHIIDIGPGAGKYGGQVIAQGTVEEIIGNDASITGRYLKTSEGPSVMKLGDCKALKYYGDLELIGAAENNLKAINIRFPFEKFICVTGVSGSGKSSLVSQTLSPALQMALGKSVDYCGKHKTLCLHDDQNHPVDLVNLEDYISDMVEVTQKPIGRTPRSNPVTYTGIFDLIRALFASLEEAKALKLGKEHFSFNGKKGQCPVCKGAGKIQTSLNFMPDIWTTCQVCGGSRYKDDVLKVTYKGKTIADLLEMEISDVIDFVVDEKKILKMLKVIESVGLSYLKLGQSATTLSGGEAQRLKLATELIKGTMKKTVYIFDEPTTGLHYEDILKLLDILYRLRDEGNTVIVIEHNMDLIAKADHIIDLGPSGGDKGGYIIATGTPYEVTHAEASLTGRLLRSHY